MATVEDIKNMDMESWLKADFSEIKSNQADAFIDETIELLKRDFGFKWGMFSEGIGDEAVKACLKHEVEALKKNLREQSPVNKYMSRFGSMLKKTGMGKNATDLFDAGERNFNGNLMKLSVSKLHAIIKDSYYESDSYKIDKMSSEFEMDADTLRAMSPNQNQDSVILGDDSIIIPNPENADEIDTPAPENNDVNDTPNPENADEIDTPNPENADEIDTSAPAPENADEIDTPAPAPENADEIDTPAPAPENADEIDTIAKWEAKYLQDDIELTDEADIKQCIEDTIKAHKNENPNWDKVSEDALRILLEEEFAEALKYNEESMRFGRKLNKDDIKTPAEQISTILSQDKPEAELLQDLAKDFDVAADKLPFKPLSVNEGETNEEEDTNDKSWIAKKAEYYQGLSDAGEIENYSQDETKPGFYAEFNGSSIHYTSEHSVSVSKGADLKVFYTILDDPANANRPISISAEASAEFKAKLYAACVLKGKVIADPMPEISPEQIDSLGLSESEKAKVVEAINNGYRGPQPAEPEQNNEEGPQPAEPEQNNEEGPQPADGHEDTSHTADDENKKYRDDAPENVKNTVDKVDELRAQFEQLLQEGKIEVVKVDGKRKISGANEEDVKKAEQILKDAADITQKGLNKNAGKRVKVEFQKMVTDKNGNVKHDKDGNAVTKSAHINTGKLDTEEKKRDNTDIRGAQQRFIETLKNNTKGESR